MANVTINGLAAQLTLIGSEEIEVQLTGGGLSKKIVISLALDRANHTGSQTLSTISNAGAAAYLAVGTVAGTVAAGDHTHLAAAVTDFQTQVSANTDVGNNKAHAASPHAPSGATVNSTDAVLENTDNHTDGTTNGVYTLAERTKLTGIASGADVSPVTSVAGKSGVVTLAPGDAGAEAALGNPSVDGYVLSSTIAGVRSWIAQAIGAALNVAQSWTAGQLVAPAAITSAAGSLQFSAAASNNFTHAMTENTTLQLPSDIATKVGQTGHIIITQDATTAFTLSKVAGIIYDGTFPGMTATLSGVVELNYDIISTTQMRIYISGVLA